MNRKMICAGLIAASLILGLFSSVANAGRHNKIPYVGVGIGAVIIGKAFQDEQKRQRIREGRSPSDRHRQSAQRSRGRRTLQRASIRKAVQEQLREFGFYRGRVDGKFGRGTRKAIARYQETIGAAPNGRLSAWQLDLLLQRENGNRLVGTGRNGSTPKRQRRDVNRSAEDAANSTQGNRGTVPPAPGGGIAGIPDVVIRNARAIQSALPNLHFHNGAVVLANTTDTAVRARHRIAQKDFADYLVLLAKPGRIKDQKYAALYGNLMFGKKSKYFKMERKEIWSRKGTKYFNRVDGIRGEDEFEKEENLDAFIKTHAEQILSQRPKFPFDILDIRPVKLEKYDTTAQAYSWEISGNYGSGGLRLPEASNAGLEGPLPFSYPKQWRLPRRKAKELVQKRYRMILKQGRYSISNAKSLALSDAKRLIIASRVRVRGIRWDRRRAILDVAAVSLAIYSDGSLRKKLADIPLPENAIRAVPDNDGDKGKPQSVWLDPELPRLYAAKADLDKLLGGKFWAQSAKERRNIEKKIMEYGRKRLSWGQSSWVRHFPLSIVGSYTQLTERDVARYVAWSRKRIEALPDLITSTDIPIERSKSGPSKITINLDDAFSRNTKTYGDDAYRAIDVAKAAFPKSVGFTYIEAGRGLGAVIAKRDHPAWSEFFATIELPEGEKLDSSKIEADFKVHRQILRRDRNGTPVIVMEVTPAAVRYVTRNATVKSITIPADGEATPQAVKLEPDKSKRKNTASLSKQPSASKHKSSQLDILRLTLGITVNQVDAFLKPHFDGRRVKRYETLDRDKHITSVRENLDAEPNILDSTKEKILKQIADAIFKKRNYLTDGVLYNIESDDILKEQIVAFYPSNDENKTIIAIARAINLKISNVSVAEAVRSLRQKYGYPRVNEKQWGNKLRQIWTKRGPMRKPARKRRKDFITKCTPEASGMYETSGDSNFTMSDVEYYRLQQSLQAAERERRAKRSFLGTQGAKPSGRKRADLDAITSARWRDASGAVLSGNIPRFYNNWSSHGCGKLLTVSISKDWLLMVLIDTDAALKERKAPVKSWKPAELKAPNKSKLKF